MDEATKANNNSERQSLYSSEDLWHSATGVCNALPRTGPQSYRSVAVLWQVNKFVRSSVMVNKNRNERVV